MKRTIRQFLLVLAVAIGLTGCTSDDDTLISTAPFPEFSVLDTEGNTVTDAVFTDYEATVVNFWSNGCGTCIEEMPELEALYQRLKERNINLIGIGADAGESPEQLTTAQGILSKKGVTYTNLAPNPDSALYKDFIDKLTGYPTTYVVDSTGQIVGIPIVGNVDGQLDTLEQRLEACQPTES